ncbi:MAG: damage-inducible protein CinA [Micavibrio aeruginosavorus]|uniref:Damage-inducible protein CinA n=1 Tax=Micavibrio aeruginosavorus TaxID=349221 RepID=A0A2W5FKJ9_9BACT|nr:MAG: damage-inducible protein CinA [Micavibrio aeruginosavorus]
MHMSLAKQAQKYLIEKSMMLVTAESCTGGMIAVAMTDIPGASKIFDRGFVTYSNESKIEQLDVPAKIIETYGAVSEETAKAMADGALQATSKAQISIAVTGVAGPDGGSPEKPVGLVYISIGSLDDDTLVFKHNFKGDRDEIRDQAVTSAFNHLIKALS